MLHYLPPDPNQILDGHDLIAKQITKRRTTLDRRVAVFACSAGSGEEVELTVEL